VGRFFFQSPEVGHKLGRQPEFVSTGDLGKKFAPRSRLSSSLFLPPKMRRLKPYTTRTHVPRILMGPNSPSVNGVPHTHTHTHTHMFSEFGVLCIYLSYFIIMRR
jgi:hypothetical protein